MFFFLQKPSTVSELNRFIRDLYLNPKTIQAFKKDPHGIAKAYGQSKEVVKAIIENDTDYLLRKGLDPRYLIEPFVTPFDKVRKAFFVAILSVLMLFSQLTSALASMTEPIESGLLRALRRIIATSRRKDTYNGSRVAVRRLMDASYRLARRKAIVLENLRKKAVSLNAREKAATLATLRTRKATIIALFGQDFLSIADLNSLVEDFELVDPIE